MDDNITSPQGPVPGHHPDTPHRPVQPMGHRPMVDGFAPRRPMQYAPGMVSARPGQPQPMARPQPVHPTGPAPAARTPFGHAPSGAPASQHPYPTDAPARHQPAHSDFLATPQRPGVPAHAASDRPEAPAGDQPVSPQRPAREKNRTGHAGLVGFIVFILLSGLLVSPFLPGKIMQNFPFASSGFSTGDQSLNCIGTQGKVNSSTRYDTKAGAPITYTYATSTVQTATCDGQTQHATVGHVSQFNPLGLLVDIAVALVVAIIFARIWRLIFGEKRHSSHHRED